MPSARLRLLVLRDGLVAKLRPFVCACLVLAAASVHSGRGAAADPQPPGDEVLEGFLGATVQPGATVRVRRTDGTRVEGTLVSHEFLELRTIEGEKQTVAFAVVDTLWELRLSKAKGQSIGGVLGAIAGAATGLAYASAMDSFQCDTCDSDTSTETLIGSALVGSLVGAGMGMLIGNVLSTGRPEWEERYHR
jgi:outer membrane lipoprotein SlyB